MKKFILSCIAVLAMPLSIFSQGWPANYGGVMLQGFYWFSGNLVGISINLCKSIQKELFINDTP